MSGLTRLIMVCIFAFTMIVVAACASPGAAETEAPAVKVGAHNADVLAAPQVHAHPASQQDGAAGANLTIAMPVGAHAPADPGPALLPSGPFLGNQQVDDLHMWLASTPPQPTRGAAVIDAYLFADDGQPVVDAKISYDIDMTNMSHGQTVVATKPAGDGHYVGDVHFAMPGPWRIIAIVERPGRETAAMRFEFSVD